jgi:NAD(P)-dependent dehydrogenase (short-subunit alcohol dehydrogenase family)
MRGEISKAVLITGCSSGIGRATAVELSRRGWTVYASARRPDSIADLAESGCETLQLDVCGEESMRAAVAHIEKAHGAVGVLINNAGYGREGAVESIPIEDVRQQFETNLFGPARLTQMVLPAMRRQRWGKVVNVSSVGGRLTFPGGGVYHASKYALEALSDALRFELRGLGVDVILIEPGFIKTSFGDTSIEAMSDSTPGPYARFNEHVAEKIHTTYTGPTSILAAGPESVARVIARAVASNRPRARYLVTTFARVGLMAKRLLPDAAVDAFWRTQFKRPIPNE